MKALSSFVFNVFFEGTPRQGASGLPFYFIEFKGGWIDSIVFCVEMYLISKL